MRRYWRALGAFLLCLPSIEASGSFLSLGDWGWRSPEGLERVAAQMRRVAGETNASFVLLLGDK
jgi:hypothetical protein